MAACWSRNLQTEDGLVVVYRDVQIVIDQIMPIYVMENRSIVAAASTSTDITISYEDILEVKK